MPLAFVDSGTALGPIEGGHWSRIGQRGGAADVAIGAAPGGPIVAALVANGGKFVLHLAQANVATEDFDLHGIQGSTLL